MTVWIDRITNWIHVVIPVFLISVILLLRITGCSNVPDQPKEIKADIQTSTHRNNTSEQLVER